MVQTWGGLVGLDVCNVDGYEYSGCIFWFFSNLYIYTDPWVIELGIWKRTTLYRYTKAELAIEAVQGCLDYDGTVLDLVTRMLYSTS
jgi:hypothetical protein